MSNTARHKQRVQAASKRKQGVQRAHKQRVQAAQAAALSTRTTAVGSILLLLSLLLAALLSASGCSSARSGRGSTSTPASQSVLAQTPPSSSEASPGASALPPAALSSVPVTASPAAPEQLPSSAQVPGSDLAATQGSAAKPGKTSAQPSAPKPTTKPAPKKSQPQPAQPGSPSGASPGPSVPAAPTAPVAPTTPAALKVRIAVDCKTAYARDPQAVASLSQAGVILAEKEVTLPAGATVKDALAATGLRVDASGGYVFGIAGLSEGDIGAASGWMYSVNGSYPSVAYTVYQLKAADRIVWRYTCNQGEDVGAGGF